ncbi:MAG: hypothetical protein II976_05045, partial [Alistipes sp.]|nr:hypothetical protein [Bacteroidaceae bacterium]MBQ3582298.1 hypothetical protein [Alistipes sp.]
ASYSQNIYLLSSHRSHKSHRERIVTLAFAIRLKTLGNADKRGRSDAPFREIREICVRLNHLCEGILVRLPWLPQSTLMAGIIDYFLLGNLLGHLLDHGAHGYTQIVLLIRVRTPQMAIVN